MVARRVVQPGFFAGGEGAVSDAWRRWLRQFFDERGPVAPGLVAEAVAEYQLALANEAIAAVLADMHRVGAHAVARIGELERSGTAP